MSRYDLNIILIAFIQYHNLVMVNKKIFIDVTIKSFIKKCRILTQIVKNNNFYIALI